MEGTCLGPLPSAFESDLGISDGVSDVSSTPTHVIVQRQLNDVIISQHAAVERLKLDATLCLNENYVPREMYEETLRKYEEEKREKFVAREKYEEVCRRLEAERQEHAQSQTELNELADKLEFALGQIELLTKQIEREKSAYQKSFSLLKVKTLKESTKNVALETKYSEMEEEKLQQEDVLESKDREIESLAQRLRAQDEVYKKQLGEMSVKLQQERYIAATLGSDGGRGRADEAARKRKMSDQGRVLAGKGRGVNADKSRTTLGDQGPVKVSSKTNSAKSAS